MRKEGRKEGRGEGEGGGGGRGYGRKGTGGKGGGGRLEGWDRSVVGVESELIIRLIQERSDLMPRRRRGVFRGIGEEWDGRKGGRGGGTGKRGEVREGWGEGRE